MIYIYIGLPPLDVRRLEGCNLVRCDEYCFRLLLRGYEYGDDRTRPAYVTAYENGRRGTPSSCSRVALHMALKALTIFRSLERRKN